MCTVTGRFPHALWMLYVSTVKLPSWPIFPAQWSRHKPMKCSGSEEPFNLTHVEKNNKQRTLWDLIKHVTYVIASHQPLITILRVKEVHTSLFHRKQNKNLESLINLHLATKPACGPAGNQVYLLWCQIPHPFQHTSGTQTELLLNCGFSRISLISMK